MKLSFRTILVICSILTGAFFQAGCSDDSAQSADNLFDIIEKTQKTIYQKYPDESSIARKMAIEELEKIAKSDKSETEKISAILAKFPDLEIERKKATDRDDAEAQYNLGLSYYNDNSFSEAVTLFRKAAEQGHAEAQDALGTSYTNGEGVSKDLTEAAKWYCKAAEQGYAEAQFNLGMCYYEGSGVNRNETEAVKWFRKAAEQGHSEAQERLEMLGINSDKPISKKNPDSKTTINNQKVSLNDATKGNTNIQKTYLDYALEGKCPVAELHGGSFSDCSSHSSYSLYLYDERIFKDKNVNPLYLCHKAAECYSACKLMENYFEKDDYRIAISTTSNHRAIRKVCSDYIDCLAFSLFLGGEAITIVGDLHDLSVSLQLADMNNLQNRRATSEILDLLGRRIRKNGVYEPFKILQMALLKFDVLNKECQIGSGIDSESQNKTEEKGVKNQTNEKNVISQNPTPQNPTPQNPTPLGDKISVLAGNAKLEMVKIEAGTFEMSAKDWENVSSNEIPHQATLTRDFYIGQTEVTQAQWKAVMEDNPSRFKGDDLPVEKVSWNDAMSFCEKLNDMGKAPSGWKFTLPTETQWEYAAKGGRKSNGYKYSGDNNINDVGWHKDNSDDKTHPVGQKTANELGLYDMSGNVSEWCLDNWKSNSSKQVEEFARGNDSDTSYRMRRGGSWDSHARFCRSASRGYNDPRGRGASTGFRLVLVPIQ